MPAAAVARRTPATGGMSGKRAGASGETTVAMGGALQKQSGPGKPGPDDQIDQAREVNRRLFRRLRLRLRRRRRLSRLVEPLDLGVGAQLVDELHLRLALDEGLELR